MNTPYFYRAMDHWSTFCGKHSPATSMRNSKLTGSTIRKADAARKVKSFIQNIMHFRDDSLASPNAPIERVAVFDEAQRAWDRDHLANFMSRKKGLPDLDMSEPAFLVSVMDRHEDWCVVVCLIGGGQEINAGEAGLT